MTRAEMLKEVVVDGLKLSGQDSAASAIEQIMFDFDPQRDRVIVFCPRRRLELDRPAPEDVVAHLGELIESGLKVHGFMDPIWIEP